MKKLLLLTGVVLMTSCHSDRFLAIDAILFDQQEQINALSDDLETEVALIDTRIKNLDEKVNSFRDVLSNRIDSLGIEVNEQDEAILELIYDVVLDVNDAIVDLNDRITTETQLLNDAVNLNADDIAAIEESISSLQADLDLTVGELSLELTNLATSLHGDLLIEVADIIREHLEFEYTQLVVEVDNSVTNVISPTTVVPQTTTPSITTETVSQTVVEVVDTYTVLGNVRDEIRSYLNSLGLNGSNTRNSNTLTIYFDYLNEHYSLINGETQQEMIDRIKAIIDSRHNG